MVLAAGCSQVSVEQLPLPGGASLGSHPYTVHVQLENALNLVPQAAVRVNDVPVGRVKKISLPDNAWYADATLLINGDVKLPANATANLEQSSLLGEKYIKLAAPAENASPQRLANGATIPLERTKRNADTEEVFGALSMLLSGGGLPQIRTITRELNRTLNGREPQIRDSLEQLGKLTGTLNTNRQAIVDALDGLNRLSSTVAARRGQVDTVLTDLSPGLQVLSDQRGELVTMLQKLDHLSKVATGVLEQSRDNTVADLNSLSVVLQKLADSGRDLPKSLQILFTYPFTDEMTKAVKGDYLNGYLTVIAAPGNDCVIPPVKETDPKKNAPKLRALAQTPPAGPLPTPCPAVSGSAPAPKASPAPTTTPQQVGPSAPAGNTGGSGGGTDPNRPALPLPTLGGN
ncbi:MCE family protein [Actinomadura logoneensis]|uniref:MCE family protein n=2 Tax=Actinomadura logoneensis TaxID=2293572 RepID=A0A372JTV8_9ACTN|nr:MCE family protein [Actinomadura logoneensis]